MDFMADQLADGRPIRTLNVLDDFNRYFPDSIRIVANRRRTRPPMEGISLCGHSAAPIW
jgi:hypothetical protein